MRSMKIPETVPDFLRPTTACLEHRRPESQFVPRSALSCKISSTGQFRSVKLEKQFVNFKFFELKIIKVNCTLTKDLNLNLVLRCKFFYMVLNKKNAIIQYGNLETSGCFFTLNAPLSKISFNFKGVSPTD
jgi:hypothetical protein